MDKGLTFSNKYDILRVSIGKGVFFMNEKIGSQVDKGKEKDPFSSCSSNESLFTCGGDMRRGYIKLWRKTKDWAFACRPLALALWVTILTEANHTVTRKLFKGKVIDILPGQLLTGRKYLSRLVGISESTVEKYLKWFESEQQLTQQTSTTNRLITITNWEMYQTNGQQRIQQKDNKKTTKRQQKDTPKNGKNGKNGKNIYRDKDKYLDFVLLTKEEHQKLIDKFGKGGTDKRIERLNNYIGSKGRKYKSHYHTILTWERNEPKPKKSLKVYD